MLRLTLALVLLVASGCALRVGPGHRPWLEYEIWTQANLELELPFGSLCVGCLVTDAAPPPELEAENEGP
jgi:hypothetical protein